MNLLDNPSSTASLDALQALGLLDDAERASVMDLTEAERGLGPAIAAAETLHLHIKVDDTDALPADDLMRAGARLDHSKPGFVKFFLPGEINVIFSHIKVSRDELNEDESTRRPRPFLDHIGVDLRDESPATRAVFDSIPALGTKLSWGLASQGGGDRPVYCCHVEVSEKHWLYPGDGDHPSIPLEFAFGALKVNPETSGCDLRPSDPRTVDASSTPCCGTASSTASDSSAAQ